METRRLACGAATLRWSQGQVSVMVNHVGASSCLQAANIFLMSKEKRSSLERVPQKQRGARHEYEWKFTSPLSEMRVVSLSQLVWNYALLCVLK